MLSHDEIFIDLNQYGYKNRIISWVQNSGHRICASMSRYDLRNESILDLGCGSGSHFSYIKNAHIVGLDSRQALLKSAEKKLSHRTKLLIGDIFDLRIRLPKESFNSIRSIYTLEHLSPLNKALEEIKYVLKRNGEFIFAIPTEGFLWKIGRDFTTKKYIEKRWGIDYDALLKKEHVNSAKFIIKTLERYFFLEKLVFFPFVIPSININLIICGRCIKR